MNPIEFTTAFSKWVLRKSTPNEFYQNTPWLKIPLFRYRGATIYRALTEFIAIAYETRHIDERTHKLTYVMSSPNIKGLKQMINVLRDPEIDNHVTSVMTNYSNRSFLEDCLTADASINAEPKESVTVLEIEFKGKTDEEPTSP